MQTKRLPALLLLSLSLTACASVQQQQATTIGGIQGAAAGAAVGAANGNTASGAIVGGLIGATTAAILNQPQASTQPFNMQQQDDEEQP